ncbi:hypothetical protein KDU71_02565 [Carboxylicivirga sediminis]|uniref:Uncharacterized protein n=1 Tax=Carboxylicivirga sediminis TaxID=2006564 RepID=A0A941F1D6_9BACT|nr:hypothetical protein [Carboxylicivirga sediminis]MBR8534428.1 hypothetical protein [Carboxylicivirga sediminis]
MDIKQTAQHLQRLGQPFDVIIRVNGVERQLYKNLTPTDVESLIKEVKDSHNPEAIIIQEKRKNGSSNVREGDPYAVALNGLENTPAMAPSTPQALNVPADFKDYMIQDLKEKLSKAEKRNDKLETENETLKKENFELEKENKYKDQEFELERKGQEYEKSNGLAGIMETVATNPALATVVGTLAGRIMGIEVPQMGAIEPGPEQQAGPTADTIQAKVSENISNWLDQQSDEVAGAFFQLVQTVAADVSRIPDVINFLNAE